MPQIKVTISEVIEVPADVDIKYARTGIATGFTVPGVGFFKPWITLEKFSGTDDSGDPEEDMSRCDLENLGIHQSLEFTRDIDVIDDCQAESSEAPMASAVTGPLGWEVSEPALRGCTAQAIAKIGIFGLKGNIVDDADLDVISKYEDRIVSSILDSMGIDPLARAG